MNAQFESEVDMMEDMSYMSQHSEKFLNEQNYLKDLSSIEGQSNYDIYNEEMMDQSAGKILTDNIKMFEEKAITMSTLS